MTKGDRLGLETHILNEARDSNDTRQSLVTPDPLWGPGVLPERMGTGESTRKMWSLAREAFSPTGEQVPLGLPVSLNQDGLLNGTTLAQLIKTRVIFDSFLPYHLPACVPNCHHSSLLCLRIGSLNSPLFPLLTANTLVHTTISNLDSCLESALASLTPLLPSNLHEPKDNLHHHLTIRMRSCRSPS